MQFWPALFALACTESPDAESGSSLDTATPVELSGYAFPSRDGSGTDSVAYSGQTFRHVLIADLKSYLGGLTASIDGGSLTPASGQVRDDLLFWLEFDSSVGGDVPHRVTTEPAALQTTYGDISSDKSLFEKLAGNDSVTDHRDWASEFAGWPGSGSPEALVRSWVDAVDAAAVARANGTIPTTPAGQQITAVYVDEEGRDYLQLLDKLLRMGITFSQGADDYLDDDVEGKGLLSDHAALVEGKPYTALEHQWDEGFGYFGATPDYDDWSNDERIASTLDINGDGAIDLGSEKVWHDANNAAKRDAASVTGTTLGNEAYAALYAGRALIASASEPLTDAELGELRGHRDDALLAWERTIAATVVHYLNEVVSDQDALGTDEYVFEDHAKHWSEAKGFALGFQFNPHSPMTGSQFTQLHDALGTAPVVEDGGPVSLADYRAGIVAARDLLGTIYGFDAQDVAAW